MSQAQSAEYYECSMQREVGTNCHGGLIEIGLLKKKTPVISGTLFMNISTGRRGTFHYQIYSSLSKTAVGLEIEQHV